MISERPLIFVLVCTLDDGIHKVPQVLLPPQDGVRYVVSWQQTHTHDAPPADLLREDVIMTTLEGRGLSRNRNHAMETAMSLVVDMLEDIVFILADDDERFYSDSFTKIRSFYNQHPKLDAALMRLRSNYDGSYFKSYPQSLMRYGHHPRSYYPASLELTFRSRVWAMNIRFDERFGLGSELLCAGEEDIFLTDMLRKGLLIYIFPEDIASTDPVTTGTYVLDSKVLRSKGAVYGYQRTLASAFLRSWREALSLGCKHRVAPWRLFRELWFGVKYIRS